jgi:hypothetical protein
MAQGLDLLRAEKTDNGPVPQATNRRRGGFLAPSSRVALCVN